MSKDWGVTSQSEASHERDRGNKLSRDFRSETPKYSPKSLPSEYQEFEISSRKLEITKEHFMQRRAR